MKIIAKKGNMCFKEIQTKAGKTCFVLSKSVKGKDGQWANSDIFVWESEIENLKKVVKIASDYLVKFETDLANSKLKKKDDFDD